MDGLGGAPGAFFGASATGRGGALSGLVEPWCLRFIGRRVVPQLYPADMPLPRERAKAPYGPEEIAGYLALADAQPTPQRRMRAAGWSAWVPAPG